MLIACLDVVRGVQGKEVYRSISAYILVNAHISVHHVLRLSLSEVAASFMNDFIPVRNHIIATYVVKNSISSQTCDSIANLIEVHY